MAKELTMPHRPANRKASVWNQTGSLCRTRTTRCTSRSPNYTRGKESFPCTTGHHPCSCNCPNTGAFLCSPWRTTDSERQVPEYYVDGHIPWLCVPHCPCRHKLVSCHYRHTKTTSCLIVLCLISSSMTEWLVNDGKALQRRIFSRWGNSPQWARASSLSRSHDHPQTRHTQ